MSSRASSMLEAMLGEVIGLVNVLSAVSGCDVLSHDGVVH